MASPFSTPPAPPPKTSGGHSGPSHTATTSANAPASAQRAPPPLPGTPERSSQGQASNGADLIHALDQIRGPEDGWLPPLVAEKSTQDLHVLLASPSLQHALIQAPQSRHESIPASTAQLANLLATNVTLASSLVQTEAKLAEARQNTQSRLLELRALERQWKQRQTEQDAALRDFSASAMYQRLATAVGEQDALCRTLEDGFLDQDGVASEREVGDYVRRVKEARKVGYLRRERKERWDEGRIGGWRG